MIDLNISEFTFLDMEEIDKEYEEALMYLYYKAPVNNLKKMFPNKEFPEATEMCLEMDFDLHHSDWRYSMKHCAVSPVNKDGENYEWIDVEIPKKEQYQLFDIFEWGEIRQ